MRNNWQIHFNCIYLKCTRWLFDIHTLCAMITKIKIINSPFVYVVRILKIYSQQISSTSHYIINYSHHVVHYLLGTYLRIESVYPLTAISPFPASPSPWQLPFDSLFLWNWVLFLFFPLRFHTSDMLEIFKRMYLEYKYSVSYIYCKYHLLLWLVFWEKQVLNFKYSK